MPFASIRRYRVAIVSNLVLLLAATGLVVLAVRAQGYQQHEAELNDGGIWVTNSRDGFHGRINKPIGQLDGAIFTELDTQLDVVQDGAAVLGVNVSGGLLSSIDPAKVEQPDGETAKLPSAAQVQLAGGTVAVLDPESGALRATLVDTRVGLPDIGALDNDADPFAKTGADGALAVTQDGAVLVASSEDDELHTFARGGTALAAPTTTDLGVDVGPGVTLTAVGDRPVVLDGQTGALQVVDGPDTHVPPGSALQVSGPDADSVLVATADRLLELDLATGEETEVASGVGGRPAEPVRLGDCVYGAWSGGRGAVVTRCGDDAPLVNLLGGQTTDLVFRVNRGEILLNDRATGAVWNIDSKEPARLDDWDAFKNKVKENNKDEENQEQNQGDRRPPKAEDDLLGARLGRTTVLHPLDNDTAPAGRLLAIRSLEDVSNPDVDLSISPDGQTVQITLPPDATRTTFEYFVDDGRSDVAAHATVSVTPRNDAVNALPNLREGFEPTVWTVPSSGSIDVPVLPDWRDKEDGDPLSLVSAIAVGGERSGAVARTTSAGRVRFTAPVKAGPVTVRYTVSDGIGEPVTDELDFAVQGIKERQAFPGRAEPDVVSGEVGKPITIRPLANDLPGSDPVTPTAQLQLAGKIAQIAGADVRTDLVDGAITLRSDQARTFFLDYDLRYGNAPFAPGRIRVDVTNPDKPPKGPVATPDSLTVYGSSSGVVDVLANDIDPTGGLLVVQGATADEDNQLDLAVVEGRYLRIAVRQGALRPNPQLVRYTISNGTRSGVEGEVVVTQRPEPDDDSPVTETDRVVVRAGGTVTVPVLDNDFSPSGDRLGLVSDLPGEDAGVLPVQQPGDDEVATGQAFVSDRFVRYVAPASLDDAETFTVRYLATNTSGDRSPGILEVQVVPAGRRNQLPEPPALEGRLVAGDTLKLKVPGVDADPDGDPVTLTGIGSAPALGRIVRYGANSIVYQSYPGSVGTDEFTYTVTDPLGGQGTGTARVAIVAPGTPQAPLAVPDTVTAEPGRVVRVDPLANDLVAAGDRVTIEPLPEQAGVSLESPQGPILVDAPDRADGRNVEVVYRITNGVDSSQATVTLRTTDPFNNPPVVFDAFGEATAGDTVTVDVLETAYDPDGAPEDLQVTKVFTPRGISAQVDGGTLTVERGPEPMVVPFRVRDADGGAASASLFVPPLVSAAPALVPGATIRIDSGATASFDLADYVVNPAGGPVRFTLQDRIWASPATSLVPAVTGDGAFDLSAAQRYVGPGAVSFEVTTGTSVDDPDGVRAVLSVPVQVGADAPILRCPDEPIRIAQDQSLDLDIASLCHVWTPDPADLGGLEFDADWETSVDGLVIVQPRGASIELNAAPATEPGSRATLLVTSGESDPGRLQIRVVKAPPPSLDPIRIGDMRAGESRVVDLAPYLRPGVDDATPTLVSVEQITGLAVTAEPQGAAGLRLTTADRVDGRAEFRVVMSDVADSTGPERQVEGRVVLEVLDVPDRPLAPVPGRTVRDQEVLLGWRAPEPNGAPIDRYELRGSHGAGRECGGTSCEVTGLTNGDDYTFQVRAHNAVGWSDWSPASAVATPDKKPGRVGPIRLLKAGDRSLRIAWTEPTTQTSDIRRYQISWPGGSTTSTRPEATITGLDNNRTYAFTIAAENALDVGETRVSAEFQSIGTPGTPAAPTVTDQKTPGDQGAVTLTWPPVDPNGPTPVLYTVLRNGAPLAACTNRTATTCDNTGIEYDGQTYSYVVQAVNDNGQGKRVRGPASTYQAVGVPEAWEGWSVRPTGANRTAMIQFTVPDSNGATSRVRVWVNNQVFGEFDATGPRTETISTPDNHQPYSVYLDVCNEAGACSTSSTQPAQTYGPLNRVHVVNLTPHVSGKKVSWSITVDTNGDPATVTVSSAQRGTQSLQATGVYTNSFELPALDIGYDNTERLTVTLSDASPARGPGTRTAESSSTESAPQASVTVRKGPACNDASGGTPCSRDGTNPCTDPSCAQVEITSENWTYSPMSCTFYDNVQGAFASRSIGTNRTLSPGPYFGYANREIWAVCDGRSSPHYDWN